MKILLLAPQPFYQERGTPIAVDMLLGVLSKQGKIIDVVTFHEGVDRVYPGVRIFRIRTSIKVSGVRPGFSFKKLFCDWYLFKETRRLLKENKYDVIHAVEESVFIGLLLQRKYKIPIVYDMDSLLSEQLIEKFRLLTPMKGLLTRIEAVPIRRAVAVAPMCQTLADHVKKYRDKGVFLLKDVSLVGDHKAEGVRDIRKDLNISGSVVMYIGNLESYQGIDFLLNAFALVSEKFVDTHLVIIGGAMEHLVHYRAITAQKGLEKYVHFLGPKPVSHIGGYMSQAGILVSPRIKGTNTPMKIYSYLHSGVAVLATDLPTHTQVLNNDLAMLSPAEPKLYAAAMMHLLANEPLRLALGKRGASYARLEHGYARFEKDLQSLYRYVGTEICKGD
jgi:glycosyltransferase involved in cell wall biosynthesis